MAFMSDRGSMNYGGSDEARNFKYLRNRLLNP